MQCGDMEMNLGRLEATHFENMRKYIVKHFGKLLETEFVVRR